MILQIRLTYYDLVLIGSGIGILLGLIPLILGLIKKKRQYAIFGFAASVISGALIPFLSIIVVAVFMWLILRNSKPNEVVIVNENPIDVSVNDSKNS